jgi:hypothetical protein
MNKTIAFTKMDFITIKPYLTLKNLLLFTAIAFFMAFISDGGTQLSICILMMYASVFVSYPFVVGEKSSTDILFTTLSIKRGTVVLGRYLFAMAMQLVTGLFAYAAAFIITSFMRRGFNYIENLTILGTMFLAVSLLQFIQLPIYFKVGYTKAKLLVYLPYMILPLAIGLGSILFKDLFTQEQMDALITSVTSSPGTTALIAVCVWLLTLGISYRISLRVYLKKDF